MSTLKKIFTLIVVIFLLLSAVAISSLNADSIELNLYWYQLGLPLGFMLLLFACGGLLLGLMLSWVVWIWPAHRNRVYWQREYFKIKQSQDEQKKQAELQPQNTESSVVKIP